MEAGLLPPPPALIVLSIFLAWLRACRGATNPQDQAIQSVMSQWKNTPSNWDQSDDPCGAVWDGVVCSNSSVVQLKLSSLGIQGTLSSNIGQFAQLQTLDLSFNTKLGGPLTADIGNLTMLSTLILSGCSFTGTIPAELGSMSSLSYLALNTNQFSGSIPASIGNLTNLYWLDLAENQLTGNFPVSNGSSLGLDLLINTKHFHFNKNQLSGIIPKQLFSSQMSLIHVLFDGNNFYGPIPSTIGQVQSLEALRLDRNGFTSSTPTNINNLTNLNELNLANNMLTGPVPNLTGMSSLNYVDMSNNSFDPSQAPPWFSTLQSLTALVVQAGPFSGAVPQQLFSFPQLQQVILDDNQFSGTLDIGNSIGQNLQTINFQNNDITSYAPSIFNQTLILLGNPICIGAQMANSIYCSTQQQQTAPYSTSLAKCRSKTCPQYQSLGPQSCTCAYPYTGEMVFRAPYFRDVTSSPTFQQLESSLATGLNLAPGSVYLDNPYFNSDQYLEVQVKLFPPSGMMNFNQSEVIWIGNALSNQIVNVPNTFGTYLFIASPYTFPVTQPGGSTISKDIVAVITVGCIVLLIGLIALSVYAWKQKQKAEKAGAFYKTFGSWTTGGKDSGGIPQVKGARWFSFDELRKSTSNFSESNEIGSGGYGKVYKGTLANGEKVAIKRAQKGSMQGALEFKTEIELLSRVHHKNLVGLVGFCFELGEQMLVYEFIPNGTIRESLSGRSSSKLDWIRRLKVALGTARGLAYLHELADPPIIHRDVKTTNILLDQNLNAKVADFGLSKLVSDTEKGHVSTQVKGTLGYLDPEYYMSNQLTEKSDVYSFGVVMLELVSSRLPIEKGRYIVREVRVAMDQFDRDFYGMKDIVDPYIRNSCCGLAGFRRFVDLALRCVEESAGDRPRMNAVVQEIEAMLRDCVGTNLDSASSLTSGLGKEQASSATNSDAFRYSGGYTVPAKVEPK